MLEWRDYNKEEPFSTFIFLAKSTPSIFFEIREYQWSSMIFMILNNIIQLW